MKKTENASKSDMKPNEPEQQRTLDRLRGIQPTQTSLPSARAGLHMESAPKVSTQQAVPVPERQEVQSVLPDASAEGRKRPGRPRLHKTDVGA